MNICIISGSSRKGNNTLRVCLALKRIIEPKGHQVALIDFEEYDIPFLNDGGVSTHALTPFQKRLINGMDKAELVLIASPEYNWFPSAELVNMVHQLGTKEFRHLFDEKVFAFCGVSTGRGGRMPAVQLSYVFDKIFNVFNTRSITCPKKFESQFSTQALDAEGHSLGNNEYDKGLEAFALYSLETAMRWSKGR